ncbi:MAG: hypothetical protein R3E96_09115 [Planctomycetota bacterium]
MGRSSLRLRYRFFLDGELALDARMTTACIDMDRLKSCELPAALPRLPGPRAGHP